MSEVSHGVESVQVAQYLGLEQHHQRQQTDLQQRVEHKFLIAKKEACCQTSFNDPDGVRTHDLRRDRAAL